MFLFFTCFATAVHTFSQIGLSLSRLAKQAFLSKKNSPILVGERAISVGERPILDRNRASLVGNSPILVGERAILVGQRPILDRNRAILVENSPMLVGERAVLVGQRPISIFYNVLNCSIKTIHIHNTVKKLIKSTILNVFKHRVFVIIIICKPVFVRHHIASKS